MQTYYTFTNFFNSVCLAHPSIETFTLMDIQKIDQSKQTIFPLANLIINNVTIDSGLMTYNTTLLVMDRIDENIIQSTGSYNEYIRNYKDVGNTEDVYNSTLLTINDIISYVYRNPQAYQYNMIGSSLVTPFEERFSNLLVGWAADMNISVGNPNNMCVISLDSTLANGGNESTC